jgi:hypothetical protein
VQAVRRVQRAIEQTAELLIEGVSLNNTALTVKMSATPMARLEHQQAMPAKC